MSVEVAFKGQVILAQRGHVPGHLGSRMPGEVS